LQQYKDLITDNRPLQLRLTLGANAGRRACAATQGSESIRRNPGYHILHASFDDFIAQGVTEFEEPLWQRNLQLISSPAVRRQTGLQHQQKTVRHKK
jgi:hypothetical protein